MKMPISGFESVASVSEATALSTVPQLLPTLVGARNSTEIKHRNEAIIYKSQRSIL